MTKKKVVTYWERRARKAEKALQEMTEDRDRQHEWGASCAADANRLSLRCSFLYDRAIEHGATRDELIQPCSLCNNTGINPVCPADTDGDGDCAWCSKPGRFHPCPSCPRVPKP